MDRPVVIVVAARRGRQKSMGSHRNSGVCWSEPMTPGSHWNLVKLIITFNLSGCSVYGGSINTDKILVLSTKTSIHCRYLVLLMSSQETHFAVSCTKCNKPLSTFFFNLIVSVDAFLTLCWALLKSEKLSKKLKK